MNQRIEPRILKGFRDFLPAQESRRKAVQTVLEQVFRRYGFLPIDTPVLEYTDVLLGKGGGETDKQIYRFEDNGGRDVSMRFDLTVPFARYMAQHRAELYLPFKRYHIAKVFRGENTQRGRYREFTQCDFDIVGVDCASADFEILLLMVRSLQALGVREFRIHLSHRGIFNRFLETLGVGDRAGEVLRVVDKIKKSGEEAVREELTQLLDLQRAAQVLMFITADGSPAEVLTSLVALAGHDDGDTGRLEAVLRACAAVGIADHVRLDPSITRGLDYYTGIVYETFLDRAPEIGSVCSGGRYNDLASLYTKEQLPGVGSSIGLDRLLTALEELGQHDAEPAAVDVLVLAFDSGDMGHYHALAEQLRNAGFSAEVYPETRKLAAQFSFAARKGIPVAVICGPEERDSGVVTVKDLATRANYDGLTPQNAVETVRRIIGR
ncbi:MAG: histidine--tRNA ligase [Spirochaetaceae bacterium]|nr:MAG: histidine--tRNA ligase [Spirochaetaceae bacterium]